MVDEVAFLNERFGRVIIARKGKDGKENTPIKVSQFYTDDDRRTVLRYQDLGGDRERDELFDEDNYILDCPQVGMTQYGAEVLYLRRVPERQWKRGYTENIVRSEPLVPVEKREVGIGNVRLSNRGIVNFVYNPKYMSIGDGLDGMSKGELFSFALSRKFAIGLKWDSKFPILLYKEWVVGWVEDREVVLPKQSHHLFEELSQYVVCRRL